MFADINGKVVDQHVATYQQWKLEVVAVRQTYIQPDSRLPKCNPHPDHVASVSYALGFGFYQNASVKSSLEMSPGIGVRTVGKVILT